MTAATGHSHDLDSADAIAEALDACSARLRDLVPQAGLLFAAIDHDFQALLDGVEARYPGLQLIGCSTHGELSSDGGFAEDSVVLTLFHSDQVTFRAGIGEGTRANPEAARQAVAQALDGLDAPVRLCITLPEGIGGSEGDAPGALPAGLLDTLGDALGPSVPVCGGLAADQFRFTETVQFCNGRVYNDAVPVLLFAGPLRVSTGVASGWEPVGKALRVTRADGLVITEIDGEKAGDVWARYVGSLDLNGARNSFAVYPVEGREADEFYLSSPSHFQEDGSMVTMNPVAQGARIRFTTAVRDQVLAGAASSAEKALAAYPGPAPDAALVFSCVGRFAILGTKVGEEVGLLRQQIGAGVPVSGFYSYGEICPLPASPKPFHHGGTFVTVLIGDEA